MKRKIVKLLLAINSLLIFLYFFPISVIQYIFGMISNSKSEGIGIISGEDGPTAIFISLSVKWYLIVMIALEVIFVIYLLLTRSKK